MKFFLPISLLLGFTFNTTAVDIADDLHLAIEPLPALLISKNSRCDLKRR